jgi:carbamoylphosphate synthase large subunit
VCTYLYLIATTPNKQGGDNCHLAGRNFEESFQKAIRMVEPTQNRGFEQHSEHFGDDTSVEELEDELKFPTDRRVFALATVKHLI